MQTTVRRFTRIVALSAIALVALGGLASAASAVEEGVDLGEGGEQLCTFNVLPNPMPASGQVHIEGSAPAFATVIASRADDLNDPPTPLAEAQADGAGAFVSADFHLDGPTDVVANFFLEGEAHTNAYAKGCGDPQGNVVVKVLGAEAQQAAQALALTGSNNTGTFLMIGVAAVVVGIVLTVGARRRSQVSA